MAEIYITKEEARKFILYKQGLLGDYRFEGKSGILDFILQTGCIQFDPIEKLTGTGAGQHIKILWSKRENERYITPHGY